MGSSDNGSSPAFLRRVFWLPVACLVAVEFYARGFDGWGAWATAPLFLLPLIASVVITAAGAYDTFREVRSRRLRTSTLVFTAIAVSPLVWLLVRRQFV